MGQAAFHLRLLPGQQGRKFIAPDAVDLLIPQGSRHDGGYPKQHRIPHTVSPAVVDALEVVHIEQHQPVGCPRLLQPGPLLIEGSPVQDAGERVVEQGILPLQQAVSHLFYLPQAAVHEPGSLTPLDLLSRLIPDEAAERALHQRLLLAKDPHQKPQAAQPDAEQCQGGQHHHQQGVLQVFMKMGGGEIDVEIPLHPLQSVLQVATGPEPVQPSRLRLPLEMGRQQRQIVPHHQLAALALGDVEGHRILTHCPVQRPLQGAERHVHHQQPKQLPLIILDPLDEGQYLSGRIERRVGTEPDEIIALAGQGLVPGPRLCPVALRLLPVGIAVEPMGARVVEIEEVGVVLELMGNGPDGIDGRCPGSDGLLVQGRLQYAKLAAVVLRHVLEQGGVEGGQHVTVTRHRLVDAAQVAGCRQQQGGDQHQPSQEKRQRSQYVIAFLDQRRRHVNLYKMSYWMNFID